MVSLPVVSVIVPVYNRETYVIQTIESVIAQSYKSWQLILVDDGSAEATLRVLYKYLSLDDRIKVIERDRSPKGAPTCRNIGLKEASGQYIIFLDSDDLLAPDCLDGRIHFFGSNPSLDFGIFPGLLFDSKPGDSMLLISSYRGEEIIPHIIALDPPCMPLTIMWKRRFLKDTGLLWDEGLGGYQDLVFHLKAFLRTTHFAYSTTGPDCYWRWQSEQGIGRSLHSTRNIGPLLDFVAIAKKDLLSVNQYTEKVRRLQIKLLYGRLTACLNNEHIAESKRILIFLKEKKLINAVQACLAYMYFMLQVLSIYTRIRAFKACAYRIIYPLLWRSLMVVDIPKSFAIHKHDDTFRIL
jgi:glycosyltransferase involved in cell wall biosynthesis